MSDIRFEQQPGGGMKASCRKLFKPAIFLIALQLTLIVPAMAQGGRIISVKVTDEKDQPVASATVQILGIDVGRNFNLKTDKNGECKQLLGNQPGTYRVVARKEGFKPEYKDRVQPELDETTEVAIKLTPGKDTKLPWEMSAKDRADYKAKYGEQQKLKKDTAEVIALFNNGVQLAKEEKYDEAIDQFSKAIEKSPEQPYLFSNRANAYTKLKKYDEALADFDKAIEIGGKLKIKDEANFYQQKAIALYESGKTDEADKISQAAAEKAKDMNPTDAAQFHLNRGIMLNNSGQTDKAVEAFKQAIAVDPNCAEAHYQLGISLSAKPETIPAAIEALKKYLQLGSKREDHVKVAKEMIDALKGK
jgi:tetratricopeptide (TPR) repeat protein